MSLARQVELLAGEQRSHILKLHTVSDILRLQTVDLVNTNEREIFFSLFGWVNHAADGISGFQTKEFDLRRRHIDIVGRVQVVVISRAKESVAIGHNLQNTLTNNLTCEAFTHWLTTRLNTHLRGLFDSWSFFHLIGRIQHCLTLSLALSCRITRHSLTLGRFTSLLLLQRLWLTTTTLWLLDHRICSWCRCSRYSLCGWCGDIIHTLQRLFDGESSVLRLLYLSIGIDTSGFAHRLILLHTKGIHSGATSTFFGSCGLG